MHTPRETMERESSFLKVFSVGAGVVVGLAALYMLFSLFSLLLTIT